MPRRLSSRAPARARRAYMSGNAATADRDNTMSGTVYLDFKNAKCKDCFRCLRECPVKAIRYENHQAKIIEQKCILCGHCTHVCPQNAKQVHSEADAVLELLAARETRPVVVSLAPSFVSGLGVSDPEKVKAALYALGFALVEETAVGAKAVTDEYAKLLSAGGFKNFITSACPAVNRMIQLYYPAALRYLAPVPSPMVAHARMLKKRFPEAAIVFIGPCIAKKREGHESGIIDAVLTFEDLLGLFRLKNIDPEALPSPAEGERELNRARYYPVPSGIIKSFDELPGGYEYVAVDGVDRCAEVLSEIDSLDGLFLEMNCCEYACTGGPCRIAGKGGAVKGGEAVRKYAATAADGAPVTYPEVDLTEAHPRLMTDDFVPGERDIRAVLEKTGKHSPEDELNCGACGYSTCRDKAIAVLNGYADIEMCLPYMRSRAESMSYEIIQNTPNGIVLMDNEFKILDINARAMRILGVTDHDIKGRTAFDCFDCEDFVAALAMGKNINKKKVFVRATKRYMELSVVLLDEHKVLFGVMKDITDSVEYDEKLNAVKMETLATTDEVIKKQMRVAQEIASLLGETTAETKVALLKLKETLQSRSEDEE